MSQNVTLSATDKLDIGKIKQLILDGKNQTQMAEEIGKRRETINRKISRWMQTSDFDEWIGSLWLERYGELNKEDKREAFRQLTKLFVAKQTRKIEAKTEVTERLEARIEIDATEDEETILNKAASILARKERTHKIH